VIAGPSRLVLLGNPVSHSLSPVFQNAALRSAGIPLTYEAIEVAAPDLGHVLALLAEDNAAGNITIPHKEAAVALCARLSPLAERVGAVNTFWMEDAAGGGVLVGDNTDVGGFELLVKSTMDALPRGRDSHKRQAGHDTDDAERDEGLPDAPRAVPTSQERLEVDSPTTAEKARRRKPAAESS